MSNDLAPTPAAPTVPGTVLAGKYRVERILGQGGMGVVVEARHIALDERVALKFLLPEYATHPEASARFLREARNAVKIKSEHVAKVTDVGTLDTGAPYMVMEFLEGRDLAGTLERTGVLQVPDAVDYIIQGSEAIAEAHAYGIVHRDLKPANLFLSKRPDGSPIVKVLDFGISKSGGSGGGGVDNLTKTTAAMGSALYMSPEQMQQTRSVDHRTDIYALGISLYELLAGKQPFYADTLPQLCAAILTGTPQPIRELRPDVSDAFASVLERAYARDRGQRYQSIAEFVIALAPFAPSRSAPVIERVARMAGLPLPEPAAGSSGVFAAPAAPVAPAPATASPIPVAPGAASSPAFSPPVAGGTQLIADQPPAQHAYTHGSPATVPLPAMDPTAGAPPPPEVAQPIVPNQIVPGHYNAPMSVRAAASFAQGGTGPMITGQPRGKGALIAVAVVGLLAVAGIGGALLLRGQQHPSTDATPTVTAAPPPADVKTTEPAQTASAIPADVKTADAKPADTASAKPQDTAPPVAPPPVGNKPIPGSRLPSPGVRPTAQPTEKKNDGTQPPAKPDLGKMY